MSDRSLLLALLARDSFRLGQFKLSAGGESDYYIDCRRTTLSAEGARLTGRVLVDTLLQLPQPPEMAGGLTLGADPIVTAIGVESAGRGHPIDGFLVRKSEKAHGLGNRIEGRIRPGARVAIVDDVCTTAASTLQAAAAAEEAGLEIVGLYCLVEREEAGGRAHLESWWRERHAGGCPFQAIFGAREVRAAHLRAGAATEAQ